MLNFLPVTLIALSPGKKMTWKIHRHFNGKLALIPLKQSEKPIKTAFLVIDQKLLLRRRANFIPKTPETLKAAHDLFACEEAMYCYTYSGEEGYFYALEQETLAALTKEFGLDKVSIKGITPSVSRSSTHLLKALHYRLKRGRLADLQPAFIPLLPPTIFFTAITSFVIVLLTTGLLGLSSHQRHYILGAKKKQLALLEEQYRPLKNQLRIAERLGFSLSDLHAFQKPHTPLTSFLRQVLEKAPQGTVIDEIRFENSVLSISGICPSPHEWLEPFSPVTLEVVALPEVFSFSVSLPTGR